MFITGTAIVCPVGMNAASACAAKRAGLSAFEELPYRDVTGEPIIGATVPGLNWRMPYSSRIFAMLVVTLKDLINRRKDVTWEHVPLLACLAEPGRPCGITNLAQSIIDRLQETLGVKFHPSASRVITSGHTGAFEGLHEAQLQMEDGRIPACVVCGVDSLIEPATLRLLDEQHRLKTPANRDGLIPGEAGAIVLIESMPSANSVLEITGLGFGQEEAPVLSEQPLFGRGLATAARSALDQAGIGFHHIDFRLSDVTGELYGFRELPLVEGRLMRVVPKRAQPLWHWAECIGDTGAAAGVAQLVFADQAFRRGYAPGIQAICLTGSTKGHRAAAVLRFRPCQ